MLIKFLQNQFCLFSHVYKLFSHNLLFCAYLIHMKYTLLPGVLMAQIQASPCTYKLSFMESHCSEVLQGDNPCIWFLIEQDTRNSRVHLAGRRRVVSEKKIVMEEMELNVVCSVGCLKSWNFLGQFEFTQRLGWIYEFVKLSHSHESKICRNEWKR